MSAVPTEKQTALHHLQELRRRLLYCAVTLIAGGSIGYFVRTGIIAFLQRPLGQKLFYTSPTGSFEFVMQVCFLTGFLLALPVICYQLIKYIEPAMPRSLSRGLVATLIISSMSLTLAGVSFAYYVSLPAALKFFNSVGTSSLHPLITIDQYFSFVIGYLATFAVIFQLPLLVMFINRIKPMGPTSLSRWRKHVFVLAFAIALILPSAPDPLSQVILALPMIVLYELSIWLVRLANLKRRSKLQPATAAVAQAVPAAPMVQGRPMAQPSAMRSMPQPPRRPVHLPPQPISSRVLDLSAMAVTRPPVRRPSGTNVLDLRATSV